MSTGKGKGTAAGLAVRESEPVSEAETAMMISIVRGRGKSVNSHLKDGFGGTVKHPNLVRNDVVGSACGCPPPKDSPDRSWASDTTMALSAQALEVLSCRYCRPIAEGLLKPAAPAETTAATDLDEPSAQDLDKIESEGEDTEPEPDGDDNA